MSKGMPRSLAKANPAVQAIRRQRVRVKELALRTTGLVGVGFGSAVLGDLPEGNILFLGAAAYLTFTKLDAGTIATFDGNYAIGTTPTADATLAAGDVDIIPSTVVAAATAGVSPNTRAVNATQVILDNTDGSLELNLNFTVSDASVSADDQDFTVEGIVDLVYVVLLDD